MHCNLQCTEHPSVPKFLCSEGEAVSPELNLSPDVVSSSGSGALCKCGEGWTCVIFRTEGPDAGSGKGFAECSGQCSCTIDDKSTKDI